MYILLGSPEPPGTGILLKNLYILLFCIVSQLGGSGDEFVRSISVHRESDPDPDLDLSIHIEEEGSISISIRYMEIERDIIRYNDISAYISLYLPVTVISLCIPTPLGRERYR